MARRNGTQQQHKSKAGRGKRGAGVNGARVARTQSRAKRLLSKLKFW
jgi:hypothetical protein